MFGIWSIEVSDLRICREHFSRSPSGCESGLVRAEVWLPDTGWERKTNWMLSL